MCTSEGGRKEGVSIGVGGRKGCGLLRATGGGVDRSGRREGMCPAEGRRKGCGLLRGVGMVVEYCGGHVGV